MPTVRPAYCMLPADLRDQIIELLASTGQLTEEAIFYDLIRDADELAFVRKTSDPDAEMKGERLYAKRWHVSTRRARELLKSPAWRQWAKELGVVAPACRPASGADGADPERFRSGSGAVEDGSMPKTSPKRSGSGAVPERFRSGTPSKDRANVQHSGPDPTDPTDPIDPEIVGAVDAVDCRARPAQPRPLSGTEQHLELGLDEADRRRRLDLLNALQKANEAGDSVQRRNLFVLLEELGRKGEANKARPAAGDGPFRRVEHEIDLGLSPDRRFTEDRTLPPDGNSAMKRAERVVS